MNETWSVSVQNKGFVSRTFRTVQLWNRARQRAHTARTMGTPWLIELGNRHGRIADPARGTLLTILPMAYHR